MRLIVTDKLAHYPYYVPNMPELVLIGPDARQLTLQHYSTL